MIYDKTKNFNFNYSNDKKLGDIIKNNGQVVNSYIDNILVKDFGLTRADHHGNHNNIEIEFSLPGASWNTQCARITFVNIYKLNNSNCFLALKTISEILKPYGQDGYLTLTQDTPFEDIIKGSKNRDYYFRVKNYFYFTLTFLLEGICEAKNDYISYNIIKNDSVINNLCFSNYFSAGPIKTTSFSFNLPFKIMSNDYITTLSVLNSDNALPCFGVGQINDNKIFIDFTQNTSTEDKLEKFGVPDENNILTNIFTYEAEKIQYGMANIFSNYNFYDMNNKMPITPIFISDSDTSTEYYFDKILLGIAQTSKNFYDLKNARYQLNGKVYRNLGGCYLFEEGDVK